MAYFEDEGKGRENGGVVVMVVITATTTTMMMMMMTTTTTIKEPFIFYAGSRSPFIEPAGIHLCSSECMICGQFSQIVNSN